VAHVDDGALEQARSKDCGVIVATAHLGPPQFLMHWMVDQNLPLMAWTATRTPPAGAEHTVYLDPRKQDERSVLLVKSALHLRRGGVLLGAADLATGEHPISIERLGMRRQFSAGLPALWARNPFPVVSFDDPPAEYIAAIDRAAAVLGLGEPPSSGVFFEESLRHHAGGACGMELGEAERPIYSELCRIKV
jgi:hypothetical protein